VNTTQVPSNLAVMPGGEPTTFDSLARLVPDELQVAYYRVLAHTRGLSLDDEMLRILEAMGVLALLTRHTPKDIADEREHFQNLQTMPGGRCSATFANWRHGSLICPVRSKLGWPRRR
jgi:hypothetical protein